MGSALLAYIAGVVTILSPCVLPLLPIIIGSSLNEHKRGPLFLVAGLILSFTVFGMVIATIGFSIGLTASVLQSIAAWLLIFFGVILLFKPLHEKFSATTSSLTGGMNNRIMGLNFSGLHGQFILGILLGAVWSPCVGPTLGAAISLASQGQDLLYATIIMLLFSIGTSTPILAMSFASRQAMMNMKTSMMKTSGLLKLLMGALFCIVGIMILTGAMTEMEAILLGFMPKGLADFIYKF